MGTTTKTALCLIGSLVFAAGAASAQMRADCPVNGPHYPDCQHRMQQMHNGVPHGFKAPCAKFENHQAMLRDRLQLTDAQKPAWEAYAGAVAASHKHAKRPMIEPGATTQQRIDARAAHMKARAADLEAVSHARKELVKVLTAEQAMTLESFEARMHEPRMHEPRHKGERPHHGKVQHHANPPCAVL